MDILSQRYGCPFFILDDFIRLNQLHDFIYEIVSTINEEKKEQVQWEFYLHKVFDMSYSEYMSKMNEPESEQMTNEEMMKIINESHGIVDSYEEERW